MSDVVDKMLEVLDLSRMKGSIKQAEITAIDKDTDTCTIMLEGMEYENISLKILNEVSNYVLYPLEGTVCNIFRLESNLQTMYLLNFQDVESIKINNQTEINIQAETGNINITTTNWKGEEILLNLQKNYELTAEKIIFNGGENGGLPITNNLVQKINALENAYNTLLQNLQAIIITLAPSGTVPFAPFVASSSPIQPLTQDSDIENTKITQ